MPEKVSQGLVGDVPKRASLAGFWSHASCMLVWGTFPSELVGLAPEL